MFREKEGVVDDVEALNYEFEKKIAYIPRGAD